MPAQYGDEQSNLDVSRTVIEFPGLLSGYGLKRILWQYFVVDFNAVSLFLVGGIPLVVFGAVFGTHHWIESVVNGVLASTGTVMVAVLPFVLGFQLLLQALVLDVSKCATAILASATSPDGHYVDEVSQSSSLTEACSLKVNDESLSEDLVLKSESQAPV
jgi:hypothetical protein